LFGMIYLMPVFLSFVRGHGPLRIGEIMLVTGAAQLLMAPLAVQLEKHVDARLLTLIGFTVFALGLALSMQQSADTDYNEMFWPQVIRGASVMLCRSEEHTSELQSRVDLVCRLLLEKKTA